MTNSVSAGTPDVVKINWVLSPIYNTVEMLLRSKEMSLQSTHTYTHKLYIME